MPTLRQCAILLASLAIVTGCSTRAARSGSAKAEVRSLDQRDKGKTLMIEVDVMENQVMRFADTYVATVSQAVDDFNALPTTPPAAREQAVRWKLSQGTIAFINATGPNPLLNIIDMVIFASVSRFVMEDEIKRVFGEGALPILEVHRQQEARIWIAVDRVLKPDLQRDLREKIKKWHDDHPNQRYVAATRLQELAAALGANPQAASTSPNNIFRMLMLDPLSGLDPTAAAIQETRRMAERAMYYTQRMPTLLSWQLELMTRQFSGQPETKQLLAQADQITKSFASYAKVADQLPQLVNDQREAAIRQVFDGLAAEEKKFRELLTELRQTITAGTEMAGAVNTSIRALDDFVQSVTPPRGTNAVAPAGGGVKPRAFDVLDYGQAAGEIGVAATQLTALVTTLNQTKPQLDNLIDRTSAQSRDLVDYAFNRALWLLAFILVGGLLVLWVARRLRTN